MKLGLDLELDFDFQADVGVELDGLALPGEVKLDLELDFIVENRHLKRVANELLCLSSIFYTEGEIKVCLFW